MAVKSFLNSGKLIEELNHTFLTVVPKNSHASHLTDFRPISCCNVLYKFILKVIASRLQQVVEELISPNQNAFLKGRLISDYSLLAHEVIRDFNIPMGSRPCLKVDFQKAFDGVNMEFVYFILHCMGFSATWVNWIKECLSNASFSVMVNGSLSGFFPSNWGINKEILSLYIYCCVDNGILVHSYGIIYGFGKLHPIKGHLMINSLICYLQMTC